MRFSSRTIQFVAVGKPDRETFALFLRFKKLIENYCKVEENFIRESKAADEKKRISDEEQRIFRCLSKSDVVVVLDEKGKKLDSLTFAAWLKQALEKQKRVSFIIGSDIGLSKGIKERADLLMSLSKMTLSHRVALVVIAEQVYRALTIITGHPYHR